MNLFEALKVNGKAWCKYHPINTYYFIKGGELYYNEEGVDYISSLGANGALSGWEPYTYKEPCKHSPMARMYGIKEILNLHADHEMDFICKHCLVPLEATGWREINSSNADNKTK